MKNKNFPGVWLLAVVAVVLCSGCSRQLTGTVFIVTEGAQTFRLPLTAVEVVRADEFRKYCKEVEAEFAKFLTSRGEIRREKNVQYRAKLDAEKDISAQIPIIREERRRFEKSIEEDRVSAWGYYFGQRANLKVSPVGTGQADADGKFKIQVPRPGAYFVKAHAKRSVGEKTEFYRWIVPVTISATGDATLDLSNQNLVNEETLAGLISLDILKLK